MIYVEACVGVCMFVLIVGGFCFMTVKMCTQKMANEKEMAEKQMAMDFTPIAAEAKIREMEAKAKELELREKELELREKELFAKNLEEYCN